MRKVYNWIANNIDVIAILALLLVAFLGITSCSRKTQDTITRTEIKYIDSIVWHSDTIYVNLPNEKIVDVVDIVDTLYLETSVAKAIAYIDSKTKTLKGKLENKDSVKTVVKYQNRYVYKDSLIYIDRPQPYEVVKYKTPNWVRLFLSISILAILIFTLIKTKKYWILFLKKFFVYLLKMFK